VHFEKSPAGLVERFDTILTRFPDVQRRQMFGYPAAFVGGNLVTSLHLHRWVVRLPDDALAEVMAAGGGAFEPMAGRPMKAFAVLPESIVADDAEVTAWVERAIVHGRTMSPKKK
jgi:hypothetical protein